MQAKSSDSALRHWDFTLLDMLAMQLIFLLAHTLLLHEGFMYFNPHKLLDGFMYHVGLVELGEVTEEFRAEVMKAAIAWQDNGKLVKLNLRYEAKIKELKTRVSTLEKQLAKKKSMEDNAGDDTPKRYRGKSKPKEKVEKLIASKSSL